MYRKNVENCYQEITAKKYLSDEKSIINVSSEIEVQYKWIEGKRTEEITGYKLFFSFHADTFGDADLQKNQSFQSFFQRFS